MDNLRILSVLLVFVAVFVPGSWAIICHQCSANEMYSACGFMQAGPPIQCAAEVTTCFTSTTPEGFISRGCQDGSITCSNPQCTSCTGDGCNGAQSFVQTCISCSSNDVSIECSFDVPEIGATCPETTFDKAGCYLNVKPGAHIERGCVSELNEADLAQCRSDEDGDCKICHGENCNEKVSFQRCYMCDSEVQGQSDCVYRPSGSYISTCHDYMDSCAAYVIPNGKTVRGCAAEVNPEPTFCPSTNCYVCPNSECNAQLVPSTRQTCYQCDHTHAVCMEDQTNILSYIRPCPTFNFEDSCYMYVNDNNEGYRGCVSDNSVHSQYCTANPDKCTMCDANGCNQQFLVHSPTLSCVKCLETDEACAWGYYGDTTEADKCQSLITASDSERCYVHKYEDGSVRRGCLADDLEYCDTHECTLCSGDLCNNAPQKTQMCIACNSTQDYYPTCDQEAQDLLSTECSASDYDHRGCYSVRDADDVVYRDCWNTIPTELKEICDEEEKRCTRCYDDGCNNNYQGAGSAIAPLFTLIVAASALFTLLSN